MVDSKPRNRKDRGFHLKYSNVLESNWDIDLRLTKELLLQHVGPAVSHLIAPTKLRKPEELARGQLSNDFVEYL